MDFFQNQDALSSHATLVVGANVGSAPVASHQQGLNSDTTSISPSRSVSSRRRRQRIVLRAERVRVLAVAAADVVPRVAVGRRLEEGAVLAAVAGALGAVPVRVPPISNMLVMTRVFSKIYRKRKELLTKVFESWQIFHDMFKARELARKLANEAPPLALRTRGGEVRTAEEELLGEADGWLDKLTGFTVTQFLKNGIARVAARLEAFSSGRPAPAVDYRDSDDGDDTEDESADDGGSTRKRLRRTTRRRVREDALHGTSVRHRLRSHDHLRQVRDVQSPRRDALRPRRGGRGRRPPLLAHGRRTGDRPLRRRILLV